MYNKMVALLWSSLILYQDNSERATAPFLYLQQPMDLNVDGKLLSVLLWRRNHFYIIQIGTRISFKSFRLEPQPIQWIPGQLKSLWIQGGDVLHLTHPPTKHTEWAETNPVDSFVQLFRSVQLMIWNVVRSGWWTRQHAAAANDQRHLWCWHGDVVMVMLSVPRAQLWGWIWLDQAHQPQSPTWLVMFTNLNYSINTTTLIKTKLRSINKKKKHQRFIFSKDRDKDLYTK